MKKSIKRASSIALAMMMAGSMMPMAFAENQTIDQANPTAGHIELSYTVDSTYKVTYPATVDAAAGELSDTLEKTFTINVSDVALESGKDLKVSLAASENDTANSIPLENAGDSSKTITIVFGVAGTEYTRGQIISQNISNNKGDAAKEINIGYKLASADELKSKPSGKYTGRIVISAEPVAKA